MLTVLAKIWGPKNNIVADVFRVCGTSMNKVHGISKTHSLKFEPSSIILARCCSERISWSPCRWDKPLHSANWVVHRCGMSSVKREGSKNGRTENWELIGNLPMFIPFYPSLFRAVYTQIGAGFWPSIQTVSSWVLHTIQMPNWVLDDTLK